MNVARLRAVWEQLDGRRWKQAHTAARSALIRCANDPAQVSADMATEPRCHLHGSSSSIAQSALVTDSTAQPSSLQLVLSSPLGSRRRERQGCRLMLRTLGLSEIAPSCDCRTSECTTISLIRQRKDNIKYKPAAQSTTLRSHVEQSRRDVVPCQCKPFSFKANVVSAYVAQMAQMAAVSTVPSCG